MDTLLYTFIHFHTQYAGNLSLNFRLKIHLILLGLFLQFLIYNLKYNLVKAVAIESHQVQQIDKLSKIRREKTALIFELCHSNCCIEILKIQ